MCVHCFTEKKDVIRLQDLSAHLTLASYNDIHKTRCIERIVNNSTGASDTVFFALDESEEKLGEIDKKRILSRTFHTVTAHAHYYTYIHTHTHTHTHRHTRIYIHF